MEKDFLFSLIGDNDVTDEQRSETNKVHFVGDDKDDGDKQFQKDIREEVLETLKEDLKARKSTSTYVKWTLILYLIAVLFIIIAKGLHYLQLSDSIIHWLLGTTCANIFFLMKIIVNYHFSPKQYYDYMFKSVFKVNSNDKE